MRVQLKAKITSATSAVKSIFGQGDGSSDKAVECRAVGDCLFGARGIPAGVSCMLGALAA